MSVGHIAELIKLVAFGVDGDQLRGIGTAYSQSTATSTSGSSADTIVIGQH